MRWYQLMQVTLQSWYDRYNIYDYMYTIQFPTAHLNCAFRRMSISFYTILCKNFMRDNVILLAKHFWYKYGNEISTHNPCHIHRSHIINNLPYYSARMHACNVGSPQKYCRLNRGMRPLPQLSGIFCILFLTIISSWTYIRVPYVCVIFSWEIT